MKIRLLPILVCFALNYSFSQVYDDYIGAGHDEGITVSSSDEQIRPGWNESAAANNTINGDGLDGRLLETSRFLSQATFGTDLEYIKAVAEGSYEDWIDAQFELSSPEMNQLTRDIFQQALQMWINNGGDPEDYFGPYVLHFLYAWWQTNLNNEDLLRQRVTLALSEIFVISWNSGLNDHGVGLSDYYDMLSDNAFGNFRDLLQDVTLHPMMGFFLSHYNNPKSFPEYNIHPDENYAREIMQLFTIGLYELNPDGTYVLDGNGNRIPTYDNDDIKEFAKIFTGLGPADIHPNPWYGAPEFGIDFYFAIKDLPLVMYEQWHEAGEKNLLNGVTVPPGQTGMRDIEDGLDNLFNHPNVGPFIARLLIQRLVKSNPSPQYISNVANAFNNTNGVRGDMKAVIKAILLDEEARSCAWVTEPSNGKLTEPMIRYFNVARQLEVHNPNDFDWNNGYSFFNVTRQAPLGAPSVFNFFLPDFTPNGVISEQNLVAPEFQIHNSFSSLAYVNEVDYWTWAGYSNLFQVWENQGESATLDFEVLKYYARDPEVLINRLDKLFTHGMLSEETKEIMRNAIEPLQGNNPDIDYMYYRVKMALYLILISPDYAVKR